jgi:hypothetical protein
MEVNRNEDKILRQAIDAWERSGKLSPEKAEELKQDIIPRYSARQQIAQYFFIIAVSCTILAFTAIFIDDKLLERIRNYFALSNIFIAVLCALLAAAWFIYILKRRKNFSAGAYEVYAVLGALLSLTSLVYFCKEIGFGAAYTGFLCVVFIVLLSLSVVLGSRLLWLGGILALMGWYGAFSDLHSSNNLFLGMNYPMRFTAFGLVVTGLALLQSIVKKISFTQRITYVAGLIIFFTGMWGVSVFGNYGNLEAWQSVRQVQVLYYSFIFAAAAVLAFYLGIKYRDDLTRDMGIIFILLNLYSRYFEYFWDNMNKGIFFTVLAVSFWYIGRRIDKRRKNISAPDQKS